MPSKIDSSVIGKLLGLGFTQSEIEYQFTGPWDAQPDRELDQVKPIAFNSDPMIELRGMTANEIQKKLKKEGMLNMIESVTGERPAQGTANKVLADQIVKLMGGK